MDDLLCGKLHRQLLTFTEENAICAGNVSFLGSLTKALASYDELQLPSNIEVAGMPSVVRVDGAEEPKVKRLKLSNGHSAGAPAKGASSRIFSPFRVL